MNFIGVRTYELVMFISFDMLLIADLFLRSLYALQEMSTWPGFDSRPGRCRVKTLGKFLTPVCNVVLYTGNII